MGERFLSLISIGSILTGWLAPIEAGLRIASLLIGIVVGIITIWKFIESKLNKGK